MISRKAGRGTSRPDTEVQGASASPRPPHDAAWLQTPVAPGWMDPLPARDEWIRDRLERVAFSRVEVVNKWRKVTAKADDAAQNMSADTALGAAYDAGRIACEAVLACHHVRVRSGNGHHERVFSAVAAFEIAGCADLVADSEEIRIARHESEYGSELPSDEDVRHARAWMDRYLPVLRSALAKLDPELAPYLP